MAMSPVSADGMAEAALAQRDRWDPQVSQGDTYRYVVCEVARTCYEITLEALGSGDMVAWNMSLVDRIGHYERDDDGAFHRVFEVTGDVDEDVRRMAYAGAYSARGGLVAEFGPGSWSVSDPPYGIGEEARSIRDTLLLVGGKVPVGDGILLEHRPVLEEGEVWTRPGHSRISVDGGGHGYSFGDTSYGGLWHLSYRTDSDIAGILVHPDLVFPVSVTVTGGYADVAGDPAISSKFWLRLLEAPGMEAPVEEPEPEAEIPVEVPAPEPVVQEPVEEPAVPEPEVPEDSILDAIAEIPGIILDAVSDILAPEPPGGVTADGREVGRSEIGGGYASAEILAGDQDYIVLSFPRVQLDSRTGGTDDGFDVLINGNRTEYADVSTESHRMLRISGLDSGAHGIEIFPLGADVRCSGNASCITGLLADVTDGDTIRLDDGTRVRFALVSAPEIYEPGGVYAKESILEVCPPGSRIIVDEDDGQTAGSFGRVVGVVYCNGLNLNEHLLVSSAGEISTEFCARSEFARTGWARGC